MCRNYDAGPCEEDGCTGRVTCRDFFDRRCAEHSYNGRNSMIEDDDGDDRAVSSSAPPESR